MTKLSKILKIVAVVAFLTALAVNIQITLTDPFVGMSEEAIATGTGSSSGSSGESGNWIKNIEITFKTDSTYTTSLGCPEGQVKNCVITTTTRKTTCLYGGNEPCTSDTKKTTDTYCGNCGNP